MIFQLCLGTLLVGAELAESAGLKEKLVTNQERFKKICMVLSDNSSGTQERFECIAPIIAAIQQYQYVPESDLLIETMIGATKLAATKLLEHDEVIPQDLKEHLDRLSNSKRTNDHFQELDALRALESILADQSMPTEMSCSETVRQLVKVVWNYVFMHYYWIKEHQTEKP